MNSTDAASTAPKKAPGRPVEIEEWSNLRLIHPLSRALVGRLIATPVTPNMVSAAGAAAAAAGATAFVYLPWPSCALVGAAFLAGWHVLDGADGDLARRTGRASPNGELVDGVCDHLGQAAVYLAFAVMVWPALGWWGVTLALASGLSRAVQASGYEALRRKYRRWVYGANWIRQTLPGLEQSARSPFDRLKIVLGRAYVGVSTAVGADDAAVERAMAARIAAGDEAAARALCGDRLRPLVKRAALLCANYRSLAMALAVLAGAPLAFLIWELVALNLALVALRGAEKRALAGLAAALEAS